MLLSKAKPGESHRCTSSIPSCIPSNSLHWLGITSVPRTKFTFKFEYKKKRDVSLTVSNAQVTELSNKEWSMEVGYTKKQMKMPFRIRVGHHLEK